MLFLRRFLVGLAVTFATAAQAQPVELAGVKYEPALQVGDSKLVLNGAGIRYKVVVKVYTAGLYLASKASTPEAALAAPGAKRIHLVMLRDIDANELGKLFTRAMQDNAAREEFSKSIPGTIRMGEMFAVRKKLVAGDSVSIDWLPGTGTTISVNGKRDSGDPIKEPEFFNALMKIWLGKSPADYNLKEALLGHARSA
jgi:hypothetical protein